VSTVIKDRFYSLSRTNIPNGPRIAVIGRRTLSYDEAATPVTNTDGTNTYLNRADEIPDLDPYNAINEKDVIEIFGYGSDLHRAFKEAIAGGARRVTLIALPEDTVFDHNNGIIESAAYTASAGSNTLFADAFAAAEAARANMVVPYGRGAGPNEFQNPATPSDDQEIGFHADNTSTAANSWLYKVATQCAAITANSHPCFAIMGIKPYVGASGSSGSMTPAAVNGHIGTGGLANLISREDSTLDNDGIYVSVVAAEMTPVGYNAVTTFGYSNGATMYAGALSQLVSWSAPTGKTAFNVASLRYNPTRTQQQNLIDAGIVPVALDFNRVPRWVDGQTFSKEASDYARLTTLRIVFDAVQMVRGVSQKFIGEASNLEARNSLDTAIYTGLRTMQQEGALLSSDFTVRYVSSENKAVIDLVIQPAFELRNIEVSVSVQL
jgi:hypothetical protein